MFPAEVKRNNYYEFGPFQLAPEEHRLYRNGEIVLLPPKEFDLLLLLVRNPGQVMNRESLIKSLWPNTIVEEANLNVHISALRKVLAENPDEHRYIETLPRLGYRFIATVTEINGQGNIAIDQFPSQPAPPPATAMPLQPAKPVQEEEISDRTDPVFTEQPASGRSDWFLRHRLAARLFSAL